MPAPEAKIQSRMSCLLKKPPPWKEHLPGAPAGRPSDGSWVWSVLIGPVLLRRSAQQHFPSRRWWLGGCQWLSSGVVVELLGCVQLCATAGTGAHPAPLSVGFPRQECWRGLPFPPPGHLSHPRMEAASPESPAWWVDSLRLSHQGSLTRWYLLPASGV